MAKTLITDKTITSTINDTINYGTAKAWVNFNGTGTVAIRASYNISSITDNGVGQYTLNFINSLIDENYVVAGMAGNQTGITTTGRCINRNGNWTSSSCNIRDISVPSSAVDDDVCVVAVFR